MNEQEEQQEQEADQELEKQASIQTKYFEVFSKYNPSVNMEEVRQKAIEYNVSMPEAHRIIHKDQPDFKPLINKDNIHLISSGKDELDSEDQRLIDQQAARERMENPQPEVKRVDPVAVKQPHQEKPYVSGKEFKQKVREFFDFREKFRIDDDTEAG